MKTVEPRVEDVYPLSPLQEGLLYQSESDPSACPYWNCVRVRVRGALDLASLRLAWQRVVQRHPALRTRFARDREGRAFQIVDREVELPWHAQDVSAMSPDERADAIRRFVDPAPSIRRAPLLRVGVFGLGPREHLLVWCYHHIILDGWSESIVWDEALATYNALLAHTESQLRPAPPFASYVAWLAERDVDAAGAFWKAYLDDCQPKAQFADLSRLASTGAYADARFQLPKQLSAQLLQLANENGLTLNTLLQGAWALVLSAEWGSSDIVFGTAIADRPVEVGLSDAIVGLMLATVPLRFRTDVSESIVDWLRSCQADMARMPAHTGMTLAEIKRAAGLPANEALFESLCAFDNAAAHDVFHDPTGALEFDRIERSGRTDYPLSLVMFPGESIRIAVSYDMARVPAGWCERAFARLQTIAERIVDTPRLPVKQMAWLSKRELEDLRNLDRAAGLPAMPTASADRLIEQQVRKRPDATAIACESDRITYRELWARSSAIASALLSRGVRRQDAVGVYMERCADLVPGLLAIWRLGAIYVPFDPSHPLDRIKRASSDANIVCYLTQSHLAARVGRPDETVNVDDELGESSPLAIGAGGAGGDVAYIFYTSGSTGKPNGVPITHKSLVNLLASFEREPGMGESDCMLAITTVAFDISLVELLLPLAAGGTLCLASDDLSARPEALSQAIAAQNVTVQFATPATWELLILSDWRGHPSLRAWCGGDTLRPDLAESLRSRVAELWNLYGPTETTVCSTLGPVTEKAVIDVGRPISGTFVRVVDSEGRLLPTGVAGELCIGGCAVSPGYLNEPELTAARFIELEGGGAPVRYFRTGDLATLHADGRIVHHGRVDQQIKLHGYRIEPGEIETALNALPGVEASCVLLRDLDIGGVQLIGYVVTDGRHAPGMDESALKAALRRTVPTYMVPSRIVTLPELPLTSNGKLDRRALPQLGRTAESAARELTATERQLADLWTDLLGYPVESPNDDFFELGGHSLLVAKLAVRASRAFSREVCIGDLLATPVLEAQAHLVDGSFVERRRVDIERCRDRLRFPMSSVQRRLWFLEQLEGAQGAHNLVGAYRIRGELDLARLEQAFIQLADRHEILRTVFATEEGDAWQYVDDSARLDWLVEHAVDAEDLRLRLSEIARHRFGLERRPPWLVRVIQHGDDHVLVLGFHHILLDGESVPIILRDVSLLYDNCSHELPVDPLQYGDYAVWQRQMDGRSKADLEFWREELSGELPVLRFPSFVARPPAQTFAGATMSASIADVALDELRRFARRRQTTVYNVVLACFAAVLMRYCRQREVVIGSPVGAIRYSVGADQSLGPFLNTVAMRLRPEADWSFDRLLDHVVARSRAAVGHAEAPFEEVVATLDLPRDASRTPLFQALFAYRRVVEEQWRMPGTSVVEEPVAQEVARTDLSCWVVEDDRRLRFELEYARELFDDRVAGAFLRHVLRYLELALTETARRWRAVSLLDRRETAALLDRRGPVSSTPLTGSIGQLVWSVAERCPDRVAVCSATGELSYTRLQGRCLQLAAELRARGVLPDTVVGLAVSRTEQLPVAMLGILEAGAAYVPLDLEMPPERLGHILRDSKTALIVTDSPGLQSLPGFDGDMVVLDAMDTARLEADGTVAPGADTEAAGLAYLMYTSGSTGLPKGVKVGHRQVVNLLTGLRQSLPLTAEDVLAAITTTSFDISVLELLLPLCVGAATYVVAEEAASDGASLAAELERSGATAMQGTPASWQMLLDAGWSGDPNLKALCGGEAMPLELGKTLSKVCARCWNLYGPTEATVWSTFAELTGECERITIGRPIQNTRVYILDDELALVPDGVEGEIVIAGDGVAIGYQANDELTAARFHEDPFFPNQRMYRTGDLGRWLADGQLEHLGRMDTQLKIRGYRIEGGDVESNLADAAGIVQTAVAKRSGPQGDDRLVAYLVLADGTQLDTVALRHHLRRRLPRYMIPQHFVVLDELPLTHNLKVDYGRLPELEAANAITPAARPPATRFERLVAGIWSELTGASGISASDNFFDLGGHSLLTIKAIAMVAEQTGLELGPQDFFSRDLESIAGLLESSAAERHPSAGAPGVAHRFLESLRGWLGRRQVR